LLPALVILLVVGDLKLVLRIAQGKVLLDKGPLVLQEPVSLSLSGDIPFAESRSTVCLVARSSSLI
jgi:hypothetical protein